jgi:hypothetical protein
MDAVGIEPTTFHTCEDRCEATECGVSTMFGLSIETAGWWKLTNHTPERMLVVELGEMVCWCQTNLDQAPDDVNAYINNIYNVDRR